MTIYARLSMPQSGHSLLYMLMYRIFPWPWPGCIRPSILKFLVLRGHPLVQCILFETSKKQNLQTTYHILTDKMMNATRLSSHADGIVRGATHELQLPEEVRADGMRCILLFLCCS